MPKIDWFKLSLILVVILMFADVITSSVIFSYGGYELNTFLYSVRPDFLYMLIVHIIALGFVLLICAWSRNEKVSIILLLTVVVIWLAASIQNLIQIFIFNIGGA